MPPAPPQQQLLPIGYGRHHCYNPAVSLSLFPPGRGPLFFFHFLSVASLTKVGNTFHDFIHNCYSYKTKLTKMILLIFFVIRLFRFKNMKDKPFITYEKHTS